MPPPNRFPRWFAISFAFSFVFSLGCDANSTSSSPPPPATRVLIIGIDGASYRVIEPMMAEGRLPNLARIAKEGVYGPIISSDLPLLSPRIWTTVATGKSARKHHIYQWVQKTTDGLARLNYSFDREGHAIWNILSDNDKSVGVVNWLTTYPPEVIEGVIVSSHTFPAEVDGKIFLGKLFAGADGRNLESVSRGDAKGSAVFPEEWEGRVRDERHADATLTEIPNPFRADRSLATMNFTVDTMSRWYDMDERFVSIAREIQQQEHPDLMMVLLQGIDRASHALWAGIEDPKAYSEQRRWSPERIVKGRKALEAYYEFTDALIGILLEDVNANDLVMVMSDHGFEAPKPETKVGTGAHYSDAARNGVFFARGRDIRAGTGTGQLTITDVTPTILTWMGLPIGDDMDGKPGSFLEIEPVPTIPTHDTTEILRLEAGTGTDEAMLKELKELGYIE